MVVDSSANNVKEITKENDSKGPYAINTLKTMQIALLNDTTLNE